MHHKQFYISRSTSRVVLFFPVGYTKPLQSIATHRGSSAAQTFVVDPNRWIKHYRGLCGVFFYPKIGDSNETNRGSESQGYERFASPRGDEGERQRNRDVSVYSTGSQSSNKKREPCRFRQESRHDPSINKLTKLSQKPNRRIYQIRR